MVTTHRRFLFSASRRRKRHRAWREPGGITSEARCQVPLSGSSLTRPHYSVVFDPLTVTKCDNVENLNFETESVCKLIPANSRATPPPYGGGPPPGEGISRAPPFPANRRETDGNRGAIRCPGRRCLPGGPGDLVEELGSGPRHDSPAGSADGESH